MRVFKFSGTIYNVSVTNTEPFKGIFVLEDTSIVKGLVRHIDGSIHYINGMFDESDRQLAFVELSENADFTPLLFLFSNLKAGIWSRYSFKSQKFLEDCKIGGVSRIELHEVKENSDLSKKTLKYFKRHINADKNSSNMLILSNGVKQYM